MVIAIIKSEVKVKFNRILNEQHEVSTMLQKMSEILGIDIVARDGEIGHVNDLYFDDHKWGVRYFVAVTGNWLSKKNSQFGGGRRRTC